MNSVINPDIKAIILDLDGVITSTAILHIRAWKQVFDEFLQKFAHHNNIPFKPLDPVFDYRTYIDGRPRYEGANAFLHSRNINIPYGSPQDSPDTQTVCGIANKKNDLYLSILNKEGAHVYNDTIDAIKKWRMEGKKTAVISASKNCRMVLSSTGISELFDTVVDGVDSEINHIKGKPEPDIFLYAAQALQIDPCNAAIVEDSPAGIISGKKGQFALVIGISRNHHAELLYNNGADIVVTSMDQIVNLKVNTRNDIDAIPSALENFNTVISRLLLEKLLLLLDYDGTITPIVLRPEHAVLSDKMRNTIKLLSQFCSLAIVSGRDLSDIKSLVNLKNIVYAGSHGFDIEGPDNLKMQPQAAIDSLPLLNKVETEARLKLSEISGTIVERKKFMITVHYRLVTQNDIDLVKNIVQTISARYSTLSMIYGKKVIELRPNIPWDKGKAVSYIANFFFKEKKHIVPLYLGDDLTDEDAFREVKGWGAGIIIGNHGQKSIADYRLDNTDETLLFLSKLLELFNK